MTETSHPNKIFVVEDNKFFRKAIANKLNESPNFELLGDFGMVESAIKAINEGNLPDIILLDLGLPEISGLEAIPKFKALNEHLQIVILTQFDDRPRVFEAISLGASGYLLKNASPDKIIEELEEVIKGGAPLNAQIARMVLTAFSEVIPKKQKLLKKEEQVELTPREQEVLEKLNQGLMRKEIALQLGISQHTIDMYVRKIYKKLQVNNVTTAIREAIDRGLL